jgi:hypothetical protein
MWTMIPSLHALVHDLRGCFTDPSLVSHCQLLLGWVLCSGPHNLYRSLPRPAPSLRPPLQLLQPLRLVRRDLRSGPGDQRGGALKDLRPALPDRGRHPAAQARPARLRPGVVPGRGGVDPQARGHGLGQQLGGAGPGRPPAVVGLLPVPAAGVPPAPRWRGSCWRTSSPGSPSATLSSSGTALTPTRPC